MKTSWKWILGIALGAVAGFSYWYFIGCTSGRCAITSSPVNSSLYGALMGGLLASSIGKSAKEKGYKNDDDAKTPS